MMLLGRRIPGLPPCPTPGLAQAEFAKLAWSGQPGGLPCIVVLRELTHKYICMYMYI